MVKNSTDFPMRDHIHCFCSKKEMGLRRIKKESGTLNMKHASVQGETSVKHYCKIFVNYFNISFLFELNRDISMSFCLN